MPASGLNRVVRYLRHVASIQEAATRGDAQLLSDFIDRRDEAAFTTLVRRHGPMVLGVCRRILCNQADAEDAFQATFLVLVLKASSIKPRHMVGNWLYGVAQQTAVRARSTLAKRQRREKQVADMPEKAAAQDYLDDLQAVLDQELSRLPDKYRAPVVLCDLEGKSRKEAAKQLGWPEGTVSGRLSRAREMLARRLTKLGLPVSATSLGLLVAQNATSAGLPAGLTSATAKAAAALIFGQAAAGALSIKVACLVKGAMHAMLIAKLKSTSVVVLTVSLVLGVTGFGGSKLLPGISTEQVAYAAPNVIGQSKQEQQVKTGEELLQGTWKVVYGQKFGEKVLAAGFKDQPAPVEIQCTGDNATLVYGDLSTGNWSKFSTPFKVDTGKNPMEMDFLGPGVIFGRAIGPPIPSSIAGDPKGFVVHSWKWIFELDEDILKVCFDPLTNERPKEMSGTGPNRTMGVYQREKPKPVRELLQGNWRAISGQRFGEVLTEEEVKKVAAIIQLQFYPDTVALLGRSPGNSELFAVECKFTVDEARNPKEIDFHRDTAGFTTFGERFPLTHSTTTSGATTTKPLTGVSSFRPPGESFSGATTMPGIGKGAGTFWKSLPTQGTTAAAVLPPKCIFELDADTLTLCWHQPITGDRPPRMNGTGPNRILVVFQRQKQAAQPPHLPAGGQTLYSRQRSLIIPFDPNPLQIPDIKELQLYCSGDQGQTWRMGATATTQDKKFNFKADRDGVNLFAVQIIDNNDRKFPASLAGTAPHLKVVIDTVAPLVKVKTLPPKNGAFGVAWEVADDHFDSTDAGALRVDYRVPGEGWVPMPILRDASSQYWATIKRGTLEVRIQATDLAGNVGEARMEVIVKDQTSESISRGGSVH